MQKRLPDIWKLLFCGEGVLILTFNTGEVKSFDFSTVYNEGICKKLQDIQYFKNFRLDPFSVDWNNEIGFAPEFLYENGITQAAHSLTVKVKRHKKAADEGFASR